MTKENAREVHRIYEELRKIIDSSMEMDDELSNIENEQDKSFYVIVRRFFTLKKYTHKMVIEFDEGKIEEEGKFDLEEMYAFLAERFTEKGLQVVKNGVYIDGGKEDDLMRFMVMAGALSNMEWFERYVKRWDWYEDGWCEPENLIKTFELMK